MKIFIKHSILLIVFFLANTIVAQDYGADKRVASFTVRGSVYESETRKPISDVNIEVNSGQYTKTNSLGDFRIQVKVGDELVIRHEDFETVYYTIKSSERITVLVEPENGISSKKRIDKSDMPVFNALIDSVQAYIKSDPKKSLSFVTQALEESQSVNQNGEAYESLADVYMQLKQYDLAMSTYQISLQNVSANTVKLKLANALRLNKNYQESLKAFKAIKTTQLSPWQKIEKQEGLGNVYKATGEFDQAIIAFENGLELAQKHLITIKVADLHSAIADVYAVRGNQEKAQKLYSNSLKLAEQENKTRAVKEKVKVADFQNSNQLFSDEIELRKEALKDIEDIETDSVINNESALTLQKQNYKIGNAYYMQKDFGNAVSYLEKSIEEAESKEDLVVQKDATRKLLEVFSAAGELEKVNATYKSYTNIVDELYLKKEQEIAQAARLNRSLSTTQNRILSLETDRELSESKYQLTTEQSKRQKLIIYSLFGGVILLLVVAFLMFKYIKQQKLANNLLALRSLRSQMNPHFIFNALNSVNSFIATNDERTANRYLTDFSKLMRAVLENSEEDFIPLEKEIDQLELYTQLEHSRFKDKFDYSITVADNVNINDFQIPPMLLQPYIENAVWHGLRYKKEKGNLQISITQKSTDVIEITILDDGIGREQSKALKTANQQNQNSKGMGNIKKRVAILNDMYKDKVAVFIDDYKDTADTGTKVIVSLRK